MSAWPSLPYDAWKDTYATLHLWLQIVGKIALAQSPWVNHQWHVTLQVTPRGLATPPIPHGTRIFRFEFDFIAQQLHLHASDGAEAHLPLAPQSVAAFYADLMQRLNALGLPVRIYKKPNELGHAIPFDEDEVHRTYDAVWAERFWRVLLQADRVLRIFRARFRGKSSPVHFFWGAADLAVTRFSGRPAPEHSGGVPNLPDRVVREAYSHECSSAGFWAGAEVHPEPLFYSYAYPEPAGFAQAAIVPPEAAYDAALREFVLPYDAVRLSSAPDETLLAFLESTYAAAAELGQWNRRALEWPPGAPAGRA